MASLATSAEAGGCWVGGSATLLIASDSSIGALSTGSHIVDCSLVIEPDRGKIMGCGNSKDQTFQWEGSAFRWNGHLFRPTNAHVCEPMRQHLLREGWPRENVYELVRPSFLDLGIPPATFQ